MESPVSTERRIRAALFIDFDNVYISLQDYEPAAAWAFAKGPERWLEWLEEKLNTGGVGRRSILLRRCYLNPTVHANFRHAFVTAGFQVVDCPSYTTRNKNGADILMVMDIMDALQHETHFDEFIILSGDSDFRPVILRLRMHDRRSVIVQIGNVAPAYRAACDYVVEEDEFIEEMLGLRNGGRGEQAPPRQAEFSARQEPDSGLRNILDDVADKVLEKVQAEGELIGTDLPFIYKRFPSFRDSNWFGYYSLRRLSEQVIALRPALELVEDVDGAWYVCLRENAPQAEPQPKGKASARKQEVPQRAAQHVPDSDADDDTEHDGHDAYADLAERIVAFVDEHVTRADKPVHMATVAHLIVRNFGDEVLRSHWLDYGSFRALLDAYPERRFHIANVKSGMLYDPERHEVPSERSPEEILGDEAPELRGLITHVCSATGGAVPMLTPHEYCILFEAIAHEVSDHGFSLFPTAKAVQQLCAIAVEHSDGPARDISLRAIRSVLKGLAITDRDLLPNVGAGEKDLDEAISDIVLVYRKNIIFLCERAEEPLDAGEMELLEHWIQIGSVEDAEDELEEGEEAEEDSRGNA